MTLGVIAGAGALPVAVANGARQAGRDVFVIRLEGVETPALDKFPGATVAIGDFAALFDCLDRARCVEVVLAGLVRRPDVSTRPAAAVAAAEALAGAAGRGDDALLRAVVALFEQRGYTVSSPEAYATELLAQNGLIVGPSPSAPEKSDLQEAWRIAGLIGSADIGQGCVVRRGLTLAVEAQEGTDAMLDRVAALTSHADAREGVLVKRAKPGQERRVDLPVVGPRTIERAAAARLAGIGLEAGGALLVERDATEALARDLGVFLIGLSETDEA